MQSADPYMRIVMFFDQDETAGAFLREDGDGGFAGAAYRMAREIDRLRTGIKRLSDEEELCAETTGDDPFSLVYLAAKLAKAEADAARLTLLFDAAKDVLASASDTYKKRNGHLASFEDDSGEKCWIVPFDAFESLRCAVDALKPAGGKHGA